MPRLFIHSIRFQGDPRRKEVSEYSIKLLRMREKKYAHELNCWSSESNEEHLVKYTRKYEVLLLVSFVKMKNKTRGKRGLVIPSIGEDEVSKFCLKLHKFEVTISQETERRRIFVLLGNTCTSRAN